MLSKENVPIIVILLTSVILLSDLAMAVYSLEHTSISESSTGDREQLCESKMSYIPKAGIVAIDIYKHNFIID